MHERYMFLTIAVLSPLVFERRLRLALAGLSGLFILNLWWPYAYSNAHLHHETFRVQPWFDWIFGADFGMNTWQKKAWSLAVVAVTVVLVWRGPRWAAEAGHPAREGPRAQPVTAQRIARG